MSSSLFGASLTPQAEDSLARIMLEIEAVEAVLGDAMASEVPIVQQVGVLTLEAGGKRLRPALVSIAAMSSGRSFEVGRTRQLGACMEMIHMATLIHDDVVDHAQLRRGKPTAASIFGNTASILSGDVLLAKAMRILAQDGDLAIIRKVSSIVVDLAEGEVAEYSTRGNLDLSEAEHFEILRRKTATFIEACCVVGGLCAGLDGEGLKALSSYGYHLGMAFQIADDLLDYRGKSETLGKAAMTDFREGCATWPLIRLLQVCSEDERRSIQSWFGQVGTDQDLSEIGVMMDRYGIFAWIETQLTTHVQAAIDPLESLAGEAERSLLVAVAHFVSQRSA